MHHNIPLELRQRLQWVAAGPDKVPLNPRTGQPASVTDPASWGSFEEASRTGMQVGFVLTDGDPYCIIDLDNKPDKPITEEQWALHERILSAFPSYTERSVSGRGYHIIIRGRLPHGRRRDNVEVYSSERYMICTGDVVRNEPIVDCQPVLEALVAQMPSGGTAQPLVEVEGTLTDSDVHEMAARAANGAKYEALCLGDWAAMGYPSQSEADYALLSMYAFYTRDNAQVRRLFRYSGLGKRAKAQRDEYLDTALRKIRAKEPGPADLQAAAENAKALMVLPTPAPAPAAQPVATPALPARAYVYTVPPGLVGELTEYFYRTAVRPVQEVALSAAICFLAGIAGRCFNISGTGLNQYMLLIAKTGTGKEGVAKGIARVVSAVRAQVPMVDDFIGPGAFASGQALIRLLDQRPCFMSVLGEFGYTLQNMNDVRAAPAVLLLKRVLLDLYAKSGWEDVLRSTAYSESEKNTKNVHAPCVSFLGESTPESFYDAINPSDIADGLIPRIQVVEYTGERPPRNRNAGAPPPPELAQRVADLVVQSLTMQNNAACAPVQVDADGLALLDAFDEECDDHMRHALAQGETQLWNRAHLKALKLGALLAVGCNPRQPVVTGELARWAIAFTRHGTERLLDRFFQGDVGQGDAKQMSDLRRVVEDYFKHDAKTLKGYKCVPALQVNGLVPYTYLIVRCTRLASFYRDPRGAARALKATLETMVATEALALHDIGSVFQRFGIRQAVYSVGSTW